MVTVVVAAIILVGCNKSKQPETLILPEGKMQIESSAFVNNQSISAKYTCDGENVSPPLKISAVPESTVSLALIVDDLDAQGGTFVHWVVWNIGAKISEIFEGVLPQGAIEGVNDFGKNGYGGPCPPTGVHRYLFKVYALDQQLDLSTASSKNDLEKAMSGHIIDKAEIVGLYQRQ